MGSVDLAELPPGKFAVAVEAAMVVVVMTVEKDVQRDGWKI